MVAASPCKEPGTAAMLGLGMGTPGMLVLGSLAAWEAPIPSRTALCGSAARIRSAVQVFPVPRWKFLLPSVSSCLLECSFNEAEDQSI